MQITLERKVVDPTSHTSLNYPFYPSTFMEIAELREQFASLLEDLGFAEGVGRKRGIDVLG